MKAKSKVETRQDLLYLLAQASELEHSLACQYLFAAYSLKEMGDDGLTDEQAVVVEKWRAALIGIAVQEMLHLGLVSNLLTSIGGAPYFRRANFPQRKTYTTLRLDFRLAPLSEKTLRRFICFELPPRIDAASIYRKWPIQGRPPTNWVDDCECVRDSKRLMLAAMEPLLPGVFDYQSIGALYALIEGGFQGLYPEDPGALFIGPTRAQTGDMWKTMIPVIDRASAAQAIETILVQGEGAIGDDAAIAGAHFGKFVTIFTEFVEGKGGSNPVQPIVENPTFATHRDVEVPVEGPDGTIEHVRPTILTSDVARDAAEIFVSIYELALLVLLRYFANDGESDEQRYILKQVFLSLMRYCLTPLGIAMGTLPAFEDQPAGPRAGASFEIFAEVALLPQRSSAWRYFVERLLQLARASNELAASPSSAGYPKLRDALRGVAGNKGKPGLSSVFGKYAVLVTAGLSPPPEWTWNGGVRAFFSPLDVAKMGGLDLESEAVVKQKADLIGGRIVGAGNTQTMPPDVLLEDLDGKPYYRNPQGRWTAERVAAFNSWAGTKPPDPYVCPGAPNWHNPVRAMFTQDDIDCMKRVRGLDLADYAVVKAAAAEIYAVVARGSMPPGRPWPKEKVACFKTWIDAGCPEGAAARQMTWSATSAPAASSRYDDIWFIDPSVGWAVNSNGQILHTTDGGGTWKLQFQTPMVGGTPVYLRSVAFATPQIGWAGTISPQSRMYHTSDGGQSWGPVTNLPADGPVKVCGLAVVDAQVLYASGTNDPADQARMMKSVDGGATWTAWSMRAQATALIDVHFFDAMNGLVVGGFSDAPSPTRDDLKPVVLFTSDGGRTWENRLASITPTLPSGEWGWKIHFVDRQVGYVSLESFTRGAILKTTDGGATWTRHEIDDPQANVNLEGVGFIDAGHGWVGGWGSADFAKGFTSVTANGGSTWLDANEVGRFINRFRFFGTPVSVGYASGRTIYKYAPAAAAPAFEHVALSAVPATRFLRTNDERSFADHVTMEYTLPAGVGRVYLHLWDQFGTPVRTLVDQANPASGDRAVIWDGMTDAGDRARSGVFIYRLTVDDTAESGVLRLTRDEPRTPAPERPAT